MKETFLDMGKRGLSSPWLTGQLWIWGTVMAGSMATALLLRYSSLDSDLLPSIAYLLNALSLLAGGFMTGRKSGTKGWIHGGVQGLIYSAIILLLGFLAFDSSPTVHPLPFAICAFGLGALGGILGVNSRKGG
jgi:putative membrane protein (TIGR04086 family)